MQCKHINVQFIGQFSMIGNYHCQDCKIKIDPVVYHWIRGMKHVLFHESRKEDLDKYIKNLKEDQIDILREFLNKPM